MLFIPDCQSKFVNVRRLLLLEARREGPRVLIGRLRMIVCWTLYMSQLWGYICHARSGVDSADALTEGVGVYLSFRVLLRDPR